MSQARLSGNSGTQNNYISRRHTTGSNTSKNISCLSSYHQRLRLTNLHYSTCPLVIMILLKYFLPWDKNISDIIYNNAFFLLSTISPFSFQSDAFHSYTSHFSHCHMNNTAELFRPSPLCPLSNSHHFTFIRLFLSFFPVVLLS